VRTASLGHVCWTFENSTAFQARARDCLAEGLAAGERVWYVALEPFPDLSGLGGGPGAVELKSIAATHPAGAVVDPALQVAAHRAATAEALADGYTGLRVVADVTTLVRSPDQVEAFARYEHLIDRYMLTAPLSAVCGYNRTELGGRTIAELASLHPAGNADVLFRLHACDPAEGAATLAGELDGSNRDVFVKTLERACLRPVGGELVLRADELTFVDHRALLYLDDYACRRNATLVLRTRLAAVERIVELFGLAHVRVEPVS
jgi:anti-anti-sigma regulatory factor